MPLRPPAEIEIGLMFLSDWEFERQVWLEIIEREDDGGFALAEDGRVFLRLEDARAG